MDTQSRNIDAVEEKEATPPGMRPRKRLPSEKANPQQRQVNQQVDPVSTLRILEYFEHGIAPAYKLSRSAQGWQLFLKHFRNNHAENTTRQQWELLPRHVGDTTLDSPLNIDFLRRENIEIQVCDFSADKARSSVEHMRDFERSKISYNLL